MRPCSFNLGVNGVAKIGRVAEWTNPYVTEGLIAHWDTIWNAGGGETDQNQRMVDLSGHCGDIIVTSGHIEFGGLIEFAGDEVMQCADIAAINDCSRAGVYDANKGLTMSMLVDFRGLDPAVYNNGITISAYGAVGTSHPSLVDIALFSGSLGVNRVRGIASPSGTSSQVDHPNRSGGIAFNANVIMRGMTFASQAVSSDVNVMSSFVAGQLSSRLPNEPALVERTITTSQIRSINGVAGSRLGRILVYSRELSSDEVAANYAVDADRFNL